MTAAGRRAAVWLFLLLLPTACLQLRRPAPATPPDLAEELFDRGLAEFAARGETAFFSTLERDFPASPWAARARSVVALAQHAAGAAEGERARWERQAALAEGAAGDARVEARRLTAELARLRETHRRLAAEAARGETDRGRLREENARLTENLEQLKNLTIEMELKR